MKEAGQYQSGKQSARCGGRTALLLNNKKGDSGKNSVRTPMQALSRLSPGKENMFESPEDLF